MWLVGFDHTNAINGLVLSVSRGVLTALKDAYKFDDLVFDFITRHVPFPGKHRHDSLDVRSFG